MEIREERMLSLLRRRLARFLISESFPPATKNMIPITMIRDTVTPTMIKAIEACLPGMENAERN